MDFQALFEALSAVLLTPVVSVIMALLVFIAIAFLVRKVYRR